MYKIILALMVMTAIGMAQLSLVFAAAPPQGGNPHGDFDIASTGDPHSKIAPQGNPHLCETTEPGPVGGGGGKVVPERC